MLIILLGVCAVLLALGGAVLWRPGLLVGVLEWAAPGCIWRVHTDVPVVALTFDDGPDPGYTAAVLAILDRFDVPATFFLVGERARRHPDLVAAIREAGHEVGNHADTWRSTRWLSPAEFERDLLTAERTLGLQHAAPPKLFRPAGGIIRPEQLRVARTHGYRCVLGSAYGFDAHEPPASLVSWLVRRSLAPGAIIVLHDAGGDREATLEALPEILEAVETRGLRPVRLSELLARGG